jgi:tripartite-type tricarboxylate transporter receptor subunit TctC
VIVAQAAVLMPQIRGGALKAIANLSPQRSQAVPDIATSDEGGVRGLYASGWFGIFAPKGTPKEAIAKLNAAMVEVLADPAMRSRLAELGLDVAPREQQTPEGLAAFHQAEVAKWWPIVKAANIKPE